MSFLLPPTTFLGSVSSGESLSWRPNIKNSSTGFRCTYHGLTKGTPGDITSTRLSSTAFGPYDQGFPPSWFSPQEQDLPLPLPYSSYPLACRLQLPFEDTSAKTPLGTSGLPHCSVPEDPRHQVLWLAHESTVIEHSPSLEDSWCWAQV